MECFSVSGYRAVRTVCICYAFVCKGKICEIVICDAVLVCSQFGAEGEESGVDCLEVLGIFKTVVLAIAVSVLAIAKADTGQELVACHWSDKSQVPVAVECDVAVVERSEALDALYTVAGSEVCCCNCLYAVKSCDEVGLSFFGYALLYEAVAGGGYDKLGKIVTSDLIFAC